jgi:hypothetical protein
MFDGLRRSQRKERTMLDLLCGGIPESQLPYAVVVLGFLLAAGLAITCFVIGHLTTMVVGGIVRMVKGG